MNKRYLIVAVIATATLLGADAKTEAELRARLAVSEAARTAAVQDRTTLAGLLAKLKEASRAAADGRALASEEATVNAAATANGKADTTLAAAKRTETVAIAVQKSTAQALLNTYGLAVLSMLAGLFGWLKVRAIHISQKATQALALKIELSINSRMDAFIREKDKLTEALVALARLGGGAGVPPVPPDEPAA